MPNGTVDKLKPQDYRIVINRVLHVIGAILNKLTFLFFLMKRNAESAWKREGDEIDYMKRNQIDNINIAFD